MAYCDVKAVNILRRWEGPAGREVFLEGVEGRPHGAPAAENVRMTTEEPHETVRGNVANGRGRIKHGRAFIAIWVAVASI